MPIAILGRRARGHGSITDEVADYRDRVTHVFYPRSPTHTGLAQLIRYHKQAEILRRYGRPVSDEDLKLEAARIDENTRDAATLARVKAIFAENREAYLQVFILPTWIDRVLYRGLFLNSRIIQQSFKLQADEFHRRASARPERFESLARSEKFPIVELELDAVNGLRRRPTQGALDHLPEGGGIVDRSDQSKTPRAVEQRLREDDSAFTARETERWTKEIALHTPRDGIFPQLVDAETSWLVVKYRGSRTRPRKGGAAQDAKPDSVYSFQAVQFPKADYSKWLAQEEAKIPVEILKP